MIVDILRGNRPAISGRPHGDGGYSFLVESPAGFGTNGWRVPAGFGWLEYTPRRARRRCCRRDLGSGIDCLPHGIRQPVPSHRCRCSAASAGCRAAFPRRDSRRSRRTPADTKKRRLAPAFMATLISAVIYSAGSLLLFLVSQGARSKSLNRFSSSSAPLSSVSRPGSRGSARRASSHLSYSIGFARRHCYCPADCCSDRSPAPHKSSLTLQVGEA